MFYSETLLSKTGALARVWLSANIERKLSKKDIRDTNIESSVNAIVDQGQAPLALRLSGQLLLGVVRIYSRKTRYLLEDCNEAINKIKMTFRTGNNDRPAHELHAANPASLTLQDVLTEIDLNAPFGDPSLLLSQHLDESLLLNDSSQHLERSVDRSRAGSIDLLGADPREGSTFGVGSTFTTPTKAGRAVEMGRDAPPSRSRMEENDDTLLKYGEDDGIILDIGDDEPLIQEETTLAALGNDDMQDLGFGEALDDLGGGDDAAGGMDIDAPAVEQRERHASESPLSSARSSVARDVDQTQAFEPAANVEEAEADVSAHLAQRAKRRKVLQADTDTMIRSNKIQAMQTDHPEILRPASFLPRDPVLLALMEMQKNGGFVSNILGDGRSKGWAPELRGILSLEVVRQPLKRKRDAPQASAGATGREASIEIPEIEINVDETLDDLPGPTADDGARDETMLQIPGDDRDQGDDEGDDLDGFGADAHDNTFDETTMPILHPAESGPVSQGTKHAVHLLREKFGAEAAESPSKRLQSSVLFQDLLPEKTTTRADATKMFFEVLVLATKDAIKVEQATNQLGGPLQVRAKRGLWGQWAELEAGGEIETQEGVEAA